MKAAFKWRLQNGIYGYLIDEDNQNGPFAYDVSDSSRIYPDGTIETGSKVKESEISTTVSKFSRDQYINAFESFKSFINRSYPQVSLLDVMYYYNIENDECTASASSLKCSATDIIFDATAVEGDELSVVVENEQIHPNTGEALRYRLDFTFPNMTPSGGTVVYSSVTSDVIISSSITSETITVNELTANNINTENITSTTIAASAITTSSITANTVISSAITSTTIAASAITTSSITSNSFIKNGGTPDQYLMADGSVTILSAGTNVHITTGGTADERIVTISADGGGSGGDYYQGRNITIDGDDKINAEGYTFDSGITSVVLFDTSDTGLSDTGLKYSGLYKTKDTITVNNSPIDKVVVGDYLIINGRGYKVIEINGGPYYIRFTTTFNTDGVTRETKVYKIPNSNVASAERSFAEGTGTVAYKKSMTAIGEYNDVENNANKSDILFAVGNGTSTQRSNAFIVRKDGSIHIHSTEDPVSGVHYGGRIDFGDGQETKALTYIEEIEDDQLLFNSHDFCFNCEYNSVYINNSAGVSATVNGVSGVYLGCPIGTIVMWAGSEDNIPYGWELCAGQHILFDSIGVQLSHRYYHNGSEVYLKSTYSKFENLIYAITGDNLDLWPYGDYSLHESWKGIKLPDLQQRFPLGALQGGTIGKKGIGDTLDGWSTSLGDNGGNSGQTLGLSEIPRHSHNFPAGNLATTGTMRTWYSSSAGNSDSSWTSSYTGNSKPHNNIPPFIAINFIIKYK